MYCGNVLQFQLIRHNSPISEMKSEKRFWDSFEKRNAITCMPSFDRADDKCVKVHRFNM